MESGDEKTASSQGEGTANGSRNGKKDRKKKAKKEESEDDDDESDGVFGMIFPLRSSYFVLIQMSLLMINLGSSLFSEKFQINKLWIVH